MKRSPFGQVAEVEHLDDVIATDAAGGLRLALEALHGVDVGRGAGVQDLDGDAALDADVLALVDGAHATLAEQADDAVLALDDLADFERHGGSRRPELPLYHCPLRGAPLRVLARPRRTFGGSNDHS